MSEEDTTGGAYERVFLGIAIIVTVVWAVSTMAQVVSPAHMVPTYANLVMMTVAGSFFGGAVISRRRKEHNGVKDEDDEPGGVFRAPGKR